MVLFRRVIATAAVLLIGAFAVHAGADETSNVGTAVTTADLGALSLAGVAADAVALGRATSFASNDPSRDRNPFGAPFAQTAVELPGGGALAARSDAQTDLQGGSVTIPGGELTAGRLTAHADEDAARAALDALTATVGASAGGVRAGIPSTGVLSAVNRAGASAGTGVLVEGLSLRLPDVLPVDLLAKLPLEVLLRLLDDIPLQLDADLAAVAAQVLALSEQIDAVGQVHAQVDAVQGQKVVLSRKVDEAQDRVDAAHARVTQAQVVLADARAAVSSMTAERDDAQDELQRLRASVTTALPTQELCEAAPETAGCAERRRIAELEALIASLDAQLPAAHDAVTVADAAVDEAQARLSDAQAALAQAQAAVDSVQQALDALVDELDRLLQELLRLLEELPSLSLVQLREALLAGLEATELVAVDQFLTGVASTATTDGSSAAAVCSVRGVRVVGQDRSVASCDELPAVLADVRTTLHALLADLPLRAALPDSVVQVEAPGPRTSAPDAKDGQDYLGDAAVTPLRLGVAPVTLAHVGEGLLDQITGLVDDGLATLESLGGIEVDPAIEEALAELGRQLAALPVPELDGVTTPAIDLSAGAVHATSRFRAAGTGAPVTATPGTPSDVAGGTVNPPPVTPSDTLPRTGGGVALALALLTSGVAAAVALRRPRRQELSAPAS